MEAYIGTKIVNAEPMDERAAWVGGLVRDAKIGSTGTGRPGYKVVYEDGYTSWTPGETFERAYRKLTDAERRLVAE